MALFILVTVGFSLCKYEDVNINDRSGGNKTVQSLLDALSSFA